MQRNGVAKQVVDKFARVTSPLLNMSRNEKLRLRVAGKVDYATTFRHVAR